MTVKLNLPIEDLSLETLKSIRDDIAPYAHLRAYVMQHRRVTEELAKRARLKVEGWDKPGPYARGRADGWSAGYEAGRRDGNNEYRDHARGHDMGG